MRYVIIALLCASLAGADVVLSSEHLSDAVWIDELLSDSLHATVTITDDNIHVTMDQPFCVDYGYIAIDNITTAVIAGMLYADWSCDTCTIQLGDILLAIPFEAIQRSDTLRALGHSHIYVVNELLARATLFVR